MSTTSTTFGAPTPPVQVTQTNQKPRRERRVLVTNYGEPAVWLTGGALAIGLLMVVALIGLVLVRGLATLWPAEIITVQMADGSQLLGQIESIEPYRPQEFEFRNLGPSAAAARAQAQAVGGDVERRLLRLALPGVSGENYNRWVSELLLAPSGNRVYGDWATASTKPSWAMCLERYSGGRYFGLLQGFRSPGQLEVREPAAALAALKRALPEVQSLRAKRQALEKQAEGRLNDQLEDLRLAVRRAELRHGSGSPKHQSAMQALEQGKQDTDVEMTRIRSEIDSLRAEEDQSVVLLGQPDGTEEALPMGQVVRAFAPNRMNWLGKLGVYLDRWFEFVTAEPRKGFQEGGVFPAIFGTLVMTLIMSILVVPFGVLAALYLREYAKQGLLVSGVRIAVNNLAGVPSIVFGVFGLGFFCYFLGKGIDQAFYFERLPNPTFGKGGLLWASATLALLTLPVVIVATEEALAAVPSSMREGSYACGASKWQTIRRIVLPRALPGIMTGMVLAVARGAGEVAPLMLVGVAALAPELPFAWDFPEFGTNRSFMHLGYQIYEMGFKSPDAEASIPFVYTTTLLLIGIIIVLNLAAIRVRSRLRARYRMA